MSKSPIKNADRERAKQYTLGVLDAILAPWVLWFIVLFFVVGLFTDPTDGGFWHRSGLRLYKDYGTGKEYIAPYGDEHLIERK